MKLNRLIVKIHDAGSYDRARDAMEKYIATVDGITEHPDEAAEVVGILTRMRAYVQEEVMPALRQLRRTIEDNQAGRLSNYPSVQYNREVYEPLSRAAHRLDPAIRRTEVMVERVTFPEAVAPEVRVANSAAHRLVTACQEIARLDAATGARF